MSGYGASAAELRRWLRQCTHPGTTDYGLGDVMWCADCGAVAPKTTPEHRRAHGVQWVRPHYLTPSEPSTQDPR